MIHPTQLLPGGILGEGLLPHVLPYKLFDLGPIAVTNHMMMIVLAGLLTFVVFTYVGAMAKRNAVPTGVHNFFEAILSFLRTEVFRPSLGVNADRFAPFLWTMFFFVLFCNLLGMIPMNEILGVARRETVHVWGPATANISVTLGLAVISFVAIHVMGVIQAIRVKMDPTLDPHHGVGHGEGHGHGQSLGIALFTGPAAYIWNFAPHPQLGVGVVNVGMWAALLVLELIGAFIKPFVLCVRLFANMLAGHLVLAALVSMILMVSSIGAKMGLGIPIVLGCTALSLLELFVAFLQAYIFTFLTTLFLASAVAPEH